jgi:cbb3-type cytochrome oxidase maturation protein
VSILAALIALSIAVLVGAGAVLFWAVDHGQFDDMDTPRLLPLTDVDVEADADAADPNPARAAPGDTR